MLAFMFASLMQAIYEIEFGADQPAATGRGFGNGLYYEFRRTHIIRHLADLKGTFGMGNDLALRKFFAKGIHMRGEEHLMHRAKSLP